MSKSHSFAFTVARTTVCLLNKKGKFTHTLFNNMSNNIYSMKLNFVPN